VATVEPQKIRTKDIVPGLEHEGARKVELTLPAHMSCAAQRDTAEGWAASFSYYEQTCVLRERKKGSIECEADWVEKPSRRERTGCFSKKEAIEWAYERLKKAHGRYIDHGHQTERPGGAPDNFRLLNAAHILRDRNLVPGKPGSKTRRGYELILDIMCAVLRENPHVHALSGSHIQRIYEARMEGLKWPPEWAHRRALRSVKPKTVQGDLVDLKTLLGKLEGETNDKGDRFLLANPLDSLDLGSYSSRVLPEAGPNRFLWVVSAADDAVERIRSEGFAYTERRKYKGEYRTYQRCQIFPDVIPGMLRYMLVVAFGHANRPRSWRHIRVDADVARTHDETFLLLQSLRLESHDEVIKPEWASIWLHGAYVYRREYFKGKRGKQYERAVPLSADMAAEHDIYMARRSAWLAEQAQESPWLFPSPRDPSQPISEEDARLLLECGDALARERVAEAGLNPKMIVPVLQDTAWYAYRRLWKSLRNALGWEGNKNAAYAGGWSTRSGAIADTIYARFNARLVLAAVEGLTIFEAIQDDTSLQEAKIAARVRPIPPIGAGNLTAEKPGIGPHPAHTPHHVTLQPVAMAALDN
jgi:hypothetical protein